MNYFLNNNGIPTLNLQIDKTNEATIADYN